MSDQHTHNSDFPSHLPNLLQPVLADDAQARSSHPSLMGFTNAYWSAE